MLYAFIIIIIKVIIKVMLYASLFTGIGAGFFWPVLQTFDILVLVLCHNAGGDWGFWVLLLDEAISCSIILQFNGEPANPYASRMTEGSYKASWMCLKFVTTIKSRIGKVNHLWDLTMDFFFVFFLREKIGSKWA